MTEAAPVEERLGAAFTPAAVGRSGRRIALVLLTAIGTINFIDRQILSVLIEPMRAELHFSDTQFGFLTGLSFALFYAALGVPVAMLADRSHRIRLIAAACFVWSLFTGACGFVTNFWQLAFARFGVGIGEAGGTAPSLSVLADLYPPEQRAVVTGLFTANGPLGVFLAASAGGFVASQLGWRAAFLCISALGMIAAPLLLMGVREPRRGAMEAGATPHAQPGPASAALGRTAALFVRRRTLSLLLAASGLSAFVSYGMLNWIPAYLMRERHMPLAEIARWFGPAAGLSMGLGIWGGGALVNLVARRSERAYALIPGLAMLVAGPSFVLSLMAPSWQASLLLMLLPMMCVTVYVAPALAVVQNLAPVSARATAMALLLLAFNIVGLGGGPLGIGMLSDALHHAHVGQNLKWSLVWVAPMSAVAALIYYGLSRTIVADAALSRSEHG